MRARTIREGSVGLFILVGLVLFGGLALWIRGLNLGTRSYRIVLEFSNTANMQLGAPVRYRGVAVGKIVDIKPGSNTVDVLVEISRPDLPMPSAVAVEANQSGLIGETSIDIFPQTALLEETMTASPLASDCDSNIIICDGDRLQGDIGVSFDELIRSTSSLADLLSDPELYAELRAFVSNTSDASAGVAKLADKATDLVDSLDQEIGPLVASAKAAASSTEKAANQISLTVAQVSELLEANRPTLVSTLENLNASSIRLRSILNGVAPLIEKGEFVRNLEVLAANSAEAAVNLRDLSGAVNTPANLLLLQETLDSARATFQNVQKITTDLDELTGDPEFRNNVRDLVNGLNGLVSSTKQLQRQTQIAQMLTHDQANHRSGAELPIQAADISASTFLIGEEQQLSVYSDLLTQPNWE
ncbi:MAG: MCE family protein [Cyanothece sp. SIO1E1]|nr:MCE family protein [Cyanothece sp. SIO1E1]